MKKEKVTKLAESFSLSCKKIIKNRQLLQTLTSPTVVFVSLTVINLMAEPDKRGTWS
jgi:hypothetical protein